MQFKSNQCLDPTYSRSTTYDRPPDDFREGSNTESSGGKKIETARRDSITKKEKATRVTMSAILLVILSEAKQITPLFKIGSIILGV